MKKRATVKDVALRAGVTIGTVSHVINGTASISQETSLRVLTAIEELGYVPNAAARNIRVKHTKTVGLMVPKMSNSFYSRIASVFMDTAANEDNYTVLLLSFEYSLERERTEILNLIQHNVEAIVIANGCKDEELIQEALDRDIKVIFVDRRTSNANIPYIEYDNKVIYEKAIGLLKEKGYQSVGFISETLDMINLRDRYEGFKEGMKKYQYPLCEKNIFISEVFREDHMEQGYQFMKRLLEERGKEDLPEAYVVSSDLLALGIIKAMREKGYQVPGDFGVIGCDDLEISAYMSPSLTTVRQDRDELAKRLWDITKAAIEGKKMENITLGQELIIRESC